MITFSEYTKKMTEGNKDPLRDMVKKRVSEEEWVESAEDVIDSDNKIKVTTKDNHVIIAEIDDFGNVTINPDDDKEPIPSIEVAYSGKNEGKYQIKASVTVPTQSGTLTYNKAEKSKLE